MLSIIIPFYNEEESLKILLEEVQKELKIIGEEYEIIFVDDGSNDESKKYIESFDKEKNIKLISFKKRKGKGKALAEGIRNSSGETLIFMDADLQDDPKDIPSFYNKIKAGYDLVNGIRVNRKDSVFIKIYSKLATLFLQKFLESPFSDINCGFKAANRKVFDEVVLYGNNFRFMPLAVYYRGYKVTQIPVNNRERIFGSSKFGAGKVFLGLLDTLAAYFLYKFWEKPLHFFGMVGAVTFFLWSLILLYLGAERIFFNVMLYRRPLLFLGMLLVIVGVQVIMTGFLGELIVYISKKKDKLT